MSTPDTGALAVDPFAELRAAAAASAAPAAPVPAAEPVAVEAPATVIEAAPVVAAPVAPAAAPVKPGPRYVGGPARSSTTVLVYPIEFDGKVYSAIVKSRPNARLVGEYFEALDAAEKGVELYMPVFFDTDGAPVPSEVLDFLDADDNRAVMADLADFLPAQLRRAPESQDDTSTPAAGAGSEPKSSE